MTTGHDWADEVAAEFFANWIEDEYEEQWMKDMTAALRASYARGRVEGLREAADVVHNRHSELLFNVGPRKREWVATGFVMAYDAVSERADELEKQA